MDVFAISNGTLNPNNIETENVRVITRSGAVYEGTIQLENASVHVNPDVNAERKFTNLEVVLDEDVTSKEDVEKLGICAGDFLAVEPRFQVTEKGYIKSRFLDDKLSAAILLAYGRYLKEEKVVPERHVYAHFTIMRKWDTEALLLCLKALQRPGRWIWAVWETDLPVRSMRFRSVQRTAGALQL